MRINKLGTLPQSDTRIIWILTRGYVRTLRRRLGSDMNGQLRESAIRMLKQLMPLKRGRPNDEQIDEAERLRKEGLNYADIAVRVIPGLRRSPEVTR